jgi:CBS domain-containing protein
MPAGPLSGRQLLDSEDVAFGRIRDVVILPAADGAPPWVLGLVVTLQRRHIFVNLGRVAEISLDGVHLRGGTVDLRRFSRRTGEILASELYGQPAGEGRVMDVGIAESRHRHGAWEVSVLAISQGRGLARGLGLRHDSAAIVPWDKHPELFKAGALAEQLVQLRGICEPPSITPTGRYLGTVGFQELLRQPPAATVGECIEKGQYVLPGLDEQEVARRMAAYNLIGVAVCDEDGRLLGAITVDDVLDRVLPPNWRKAEMT